MTAKIDNWNSDPNIKWFVKISDAGAQGLVELFKTKADAEAGTNRVAYGSFEFGTAQEVTLTNDTEDPEIELFTDREDWHIRVTLLNGDPEAIVRYGPVTDKADISDPLLVDSQALLDRGTREVDEGTHTRISRTITLGTHVQGLEADDKRRLRDGMRGLDRQVRIDDIVVRGTPNELTDILTAVEFEDATR